MMRAASFYDASCLFYSAADSELLLIYNFTGLIKYMLCEIWGFHDAKNDDDDEVLGFGVV